MSNVIIPTGTTETHEFCHNDLTPTEGQWTQARESHDGFHKELGRRPIDEQGIHPDSLNALDEQGIHPDSFPSRSEKIFMIVKKSLFNAVFTGMLTGTLITVAQWMPLQRLLASAGTGFGLGAGIGLVSIKSLGINVIDLGIRSFGILLGIAGTGRFWGIGSSPTAATAITSIASGVFAGIGTLTRDLLS